MSEYNTYIEEHQQNVGKGYQWLVTNLPDVVDFKSEREIWNDVIVQHDASKYEPDEWIAYDNYFYGGDKTQKVVDSFNLAWLTHIRRNPHHWQHWVLINDDPDEGTIALPMPKKYLIEMICDWWAFSWKKGDLREIFNWYAGHRDYIKLHSSTRSELEKILDQIKLVLDAQP